MSNLHERCKEMLGKLRQDAMLRQGSPVEDLVAFVVAETGRSAEMKLEDTLPLCLYFPTEQDREGFIRTVQEVKPHMRMKRMP